MEMKMIKMKRQFNLISNETFFFFTQKEKEFDR